MRTWLKTFNENPFWAMHMGRLQRKSPLRRYGFDMLCQGGLVGVALAGTLAGSGKEVGLSVAHLHILYLACVATSATASSVVSERSKGSLLTLALTKINSADYADGVALSAAYGYLRNLLLLSPFIAMVFLLNVESLFGALLYLGITASVTVLGCYNGLRISATSRDARQASQWAVLSPMLCILGTPLLLPFGGFLLLPLWLAHPYAALYLAVFGMSGFEPHADAVQTIIFWKGWALIFVALYYGFTRYVRRSAISSLERISLQ
jgi:hypothetical protein